MNWQPVIGLEIHAQLATKSKLFSTSSTSFGAAPNTQASVIDLAMPGVLPVLNQQAVVMAIKFGLAIDAVINQKTVFARKNYFYPDLPKGYQISQYEFPIVGRGDVEIIDEDKQPKQVGITRAHLEEDAGKLIHQLLPNESGVDYNRAGIALLEIVSEPDLRSAYEAVTYAKKIHQLLRYLGICDGNMQEGSFRCDANVSVMPMDSKAFGTRCELKNINSFKFLEKAIDYEIVRQIDLIESNRVVIQQTRLYDSIKNITLPMRDKEEANDYRYFPDPDLAPVVIDDDFIQRIKEELPELPHHKKQRFLTQYSLSEYECDILTGDKALSDYFEMVVITAKNVKLSANWVLGELLGLLKKHDTNIGHCPIKAQNLGSLIAYIDDGIISGKMAKNIFTTMWIKQESPQTIIQAEDLKFTDNVLLNTVIGEVLDENPDQTQAYRQGNERLFRFFIGKVMQKTKGQANPQDVQTMVKKALDKSVDS